VKTLSVRMLAGSIGIAVCVWGAEPRAKPRLPPVGELLDKYARHGFDVVDSLANADPSEAEALIQEIERRGPAWTVARGEAEAPARRLAAAAFALDVARVWTTDSTTRTPAKSGLTAGQSISVVVLSRGRWAFGRNLIGWGCQLLRSGTAEPGERLWHLAAVALAQGMRDQELLVGTGIETDASRWWLAERASGHLVHARSRFPDEPRFRLAQVVAEENRTWQAGSASFGDTRRVGVVLGEMTDRYLTELVAAASDAAGAVDPQQRLAAAELSRAQGLRSALRTLESLATSNEIRAEVDLRYGFIALRFGERELGLSHLTAAEHAQDPLLIHAARLLIASTRERSDQIDDAIAAYRAALNIAPHTRTASVLLTSLLMRSGRLAEAMDAAHKFLSSPEVPDLWNAYRDGDYRRLAVYIDQLRRSLP
jgi:hypothetical protein